MAFVAAQFLETNPDVGLDVFDQMADTGFDVDCKT